MRNIEEIAAEEEALARVLLLERLGIFFTLLGLGLSVWGWTLFQRGDMAKGSLAIVGGLVAFALGWGGARAFALPFADLFLGLLACVPPFFLYHFTRLPSFFWGRDPAYWMAIHSGAVVEPSWSPLGYLVGQAACAIFPQWQQILLPEIPAVLLPLALFLVYLDYIRHLRNKNLINMGMGVLVCWLLAVSLPLWNVATIASGLVSILGLLLFVTQKILKDATPPPRKAFFFLLGLLWTVHPLWGILGSFQLLGLPRGKGKVWFPNLAAFSAGISLFLWVGFRTDRFFPSWGGSHPWLEWGKNAMDLWLVHLDEDWGIAPALLGLGWICAAMGLLVLFLWVLNLLKWKAGSKPVLGALEFWTWVFSGVGGILFYSASSGVEGPTLSWFVLGLGRIVIGFVDKGTEKRQIASLSGPKLAAGVATVLLLTFGLAWLPGQACFRGGLYFPQEHALNLLKCLGEKSILVCDDPFESAAAQEARLIDPSFSSAIVLEKRYLNQKWYVNQCIMKIPELLFTTVLGSPDEILKSLIPPNRDFWTLHWARSEPPQGWGDLKSFPTVLTQEFTNVPADEEKAAAVQYRYDLTALPRPDAEMDPFEAKYFQRYVIGFTALGKNLLDRGLYMAAIQAFDRSLKLNPGYSEPQAYLTKMYSQQNILEAAQLDFEKTLKTQPAQMTALKKELDKAEKDKD
ncbi:MAG TPA: tetratricopeptide repeat protein, partial [bacterium]|nr:tetratricopeptide repeat protein [bacterium]